MSAENQVLDQACNMLRESLQQLRSTLQEIRTSITGGENHNVTLANKILEENGYLHESQRKLEQWGVIECDTDDQVRKIIAEVIDYRRDVALHHCEDEKGI